MRQPEVRRYKAAGAAVNTLCARTAGAEWPWLKPTEPARVAEVVHRRTKQHHELVHRCEVLRKLQPTSLHGTR